MGSATVRWISLSKSMRTGLGGASADAFPPRPEPSLAGLSSAVLLSSVFALSSDFASLPFSSSLSGASGEATSFGSTIR